MINTNEYIKLEDYSSNINQIHELGLESDLKEISQIILESNSRIIQKIEMIPSKMGFKISNWVHKIPTDITSLINSLFNYINELLMGGFGDCAWCFDCNCDFHSAIREILENTED